ncbi:AraC family transcriptional regulator [Bordetella hinzii]|uniref:AraC family transcriptional regulator n=1 Tax=Bordetella hinzii TaxID=103855 RepID=UPI001E5AEAD2|nr:AraC family transcriptional regulator [Bordetella hinzii]WPL81061.1 AraC family transcriptional regulator [Bordetella hinzii]
MDAPTRIPASTMHQILYRATALPGLDLMQARTSRDFGRHTHDQFGLGRMDAGAQRSASDARQLSQHAGQMMFVNPGEVHDGRAIGGEPRAWRMLYVDPALADALLDGRGQRLGFAQAARRDEALSLRFEAAWRWALHGGAMAQESSLLALLGPLAGLARQGPPDGAAIGRARAALDDDPARDWTLADLARECALSRFQLHRAFVRATGLAPHAYLVQRRVALARRLLRAGMAPAQAALAAGFYDQSHLARHFGRALGLAPGRYARGVGRSDVQDRRGGL